MTTRPTWWRYFGRAMRLRCPVCGISPLYRPARRTESLTDWFTMLPGCPRCGYAYEREPGYYLFALWLISFFLVAICGLGELLLLDYLFDPSTPVMLVATLFPVTFIIILTVRHQKALFLALDHLFSPHDPTDTDPDNRNLRGSWRDFSDH